MNPQDTRFKKWLTSGAPWIWLNAGAVSVSIIMVLGLLLLIAARGLGHFWPATLYQFEYIDKQGQQLSLIGEIHDEELVTRSRLLESGYQIDSMDEYIKRYLVKVGNRDVGGLDFRWLLASQIQSQVTPLDLIAVERREWGKLFGVLYQVSEGDQVIAEQGEALQQFEQRLQRALRIHDRIRDLEQGEIGAINHALERLRLDARRLELDGALDAVAQQRFASQREQYAEKYAVFEKELAKLYQDIKRDSITVQVADGRLVKVSLATVVRYYQPNAMSVIAKVGFYALKLWEFVSDEPREANTEGGIFPAIFGTVMMVMLMTVFVTPFGVVAAIYLREYARQGVVTRVVRIAVNNLAGVPSIVYGVFGLGFFVYFLGGNIDQLFFPESLPAPTFGTPGILWASMTLALLTVPVVIVTTEEGLARVPKAIHEGSLALGATKAETLWRTVLPMASPAMMTGLILAIARAAGEVAPLMLVGVVKLAPSLPLDGNSPFLHLDRKFMHLGFHVYDVGFQSPNVEAARPLVYATALLLVLVIILLNLAAIAIRNHLREKYKALEQ